MRHGSLPSLSAIYNTVKVDEEMISIPARKRGMFGLISFLIFTPFVFAWLLGIPLLSGMLMGNWVGGSLPVIIFASLWSLFGAYLFCHYYLILRKRAPQVLILTPKEFSFDSGASPLRFPSSYSDLFFQLKNSKRRKLVFSPYDANSTCLVRVGSTTQLFTPKDLKKHSIGDTVSEIEREWLFNKIRSFYEKVD